MNRRLPDLFLSSLLNLVLVWIFLGSVLPASAANWNIHAQPARLVNGGPVLFQIKPAQRLQSLSGSWLGHEIVFSFDANSKTWFALAGVSLETTPGSYALELTGETKAGKSRAQKSFFQPQVRGCPCQVSQDRSQAQRGRQVHRAHSRTAETNPGRSANQERLPEPGHARARMVRAIHRAGRSCDF